MNTNFCGPLLDFTVLALLSTTTVASADVPIRYNLARDGKVSLAIYNKSGQMVRRLHVGDSMTAGQHLAQWDGLDDRGRPVPRGPYEWRLVNSPGMCAHYLTSLGTSDGYWHWPGAHEGPGSVAVVGDTVIMAAHLVEGSPQYIAWDLKTGKVKWYQKPASGFAWVKDLALGGDTLFANGYSLGSNKPELLLLDPNTGKFVKSWSTWKRALFSFFPIVRLDMESMAKNGSPLIASVYNNKRGYGWIDHNGITQVKVGSHPAIGSTQRRSAQFRMDLPRYNMYRTSVVVGNPTTKPRTIEVVMSGRGGKHLLQLKPGETKTIENKRGNDQLRIEIRNPKGEAIGWALQTITVRATLKRIAAHGKTLVGLLPNNSVVWLDPMKGKKLFKRPFTVHHRAVVLKQVTSQLDSPCQDIEVLPNGKVVLLTEKKLLEVEDDGGLQVLLTGLTHAARVAADAKTGAVFIVEHGDSQQMKMFDSRFKLQSTFGRKGGRRQGRYVAKDFYEVEDIAGDGRGGFVIVEQQSGPRRTAHFNSNGELIREWYGAQTFFVHSWHDPRQPSHVWFDNGHGWVTECEVDYDRGTWKPYATYKLAGVGGKALNVQVQHTGYLGFHIRYHEGQKYLCKVRDPMVLRIDEENRRIVPVAKYLAFAHNQYTLTREKIPTWALSFEEARKHKYIGLAWSDLNGDGKPQKGEARLSKQNYGAGDSWIDDSLIYYTNNGYVVKPTWKNGVPIYPLPSELKRQPARANWRDSEGNYYMQYCGGHLNIHGFGWPSTMVAANVGLRKCASDGKTLLFDVGNKAVTWPGTHRDGQLHFPVKIAGVVKGVVGVAQRVGAPVEFWTTDGLYVGQLFNRHGKGPEVAYHWWRVDPKKPDSWGPRGNQALFQYDTAAGGRLVERDNGEVYFFGAGWNNVPTYRVTGFDDLQRQHGFIKLVNQAMPASGTGQGLTARYHVGNQHRPVVERIEHQINLGKFGNYHKRQKKAMNWPKAITTKPTSKFSIRLTGFLEPKLTGTYTFLIYGGPAEVLVNNKKVLDASTSASFKSGARYRSNTIRMEAGKKVPIQIVAQRNAKQALYLAWESEAFSAEIVPGQYLYPAKK